MHLLLVVKSDCVQQDNASYDLGFTHYIHEYKTLLNILHIIHEYNNKTQYFIVHLKDKFHIDTDRHKGPRIIFSG